MALMKKIARVSGKIASGGTPIANLPSSFIYNDVKTLKGSAGILLERNEIVYQVEPSSISEEFRVTTIPIVPMEQLKLLNGSNMNYIHFGALSISIDPLFKRGSGVVGKAFVYDSRWDNAEQALLQAFSFDLNSGTASIVCSPNYSVQISDPRLSTCLSTVLVFENLNFRSGSFAISVRIGVMYRPYNSFIGDALALDQTNFKIDGKDVVELGLKDFGLTEGDNLDELFKKVPTDSSKIVKSFSENYKRKGLLGISSNVPMNKFQIGPLNFEDTFLKKRESNQAKSKGKEVVDPFKSKSDFYENSVEVDKYLKRDHNFGRDVDKAGIEGSGTKGADSKVFGGQTSSPWSK
uniref:MP n=8 Tax=Grapevine berry inner necrosis virus TaxID=81877 RepID=A0A1X9H7U6_9VIRU|nr:MP [Grapevine berry inner necrosis virus]DAC85081.1 TPA_asm: MP [Grapevine berry inner necrosis virus]DAC85090.1 TPA_asm: MP [Grapevine berry inner necrosis virus]DAC85099.1 TPA_asm: MP [Grapevine berry inner necrosis virus]